MISKITHRNQNERRAKMPTLKERYLWETVVAAVAVGVAWALKSYL